MLWLRGRLLRLKHAAEADNGCAAERTAGCARQDLQPPRSRGSGGPDCTLPVPRCQTPEDLHSGAVRRRREAWNVPCTAFAMLLNI
jgi:hypothetical protein